MIGGGAEVMIGEDEAQQPRGIKRPQDDSLDDDQRFAKRFHLLNIDNQNKLYIPVPRPPPLQPQQPQPNNRPPLQPDLTPSSTPNDCMHVDDTKDRVYIHDLDEELADIESDEQRLIFLPDIEKQLSKIPTHILRGTRAAPEEHQELVLYTVPSSLSVPAEKDSVRKAILESRQRAREKATLDAIEVIERGPDNPEIAHGLDVDDYLIEEDTENDPDAMDIG